MSGEAWFLLAVLFLVVICWLGGIYYRRVAGTGMDQVQPEKHSSHYTYRAFNHSVRRFQWFYLEDVEKQKGPINWRSLSIDQYIGRLDSNGDPIYSMDKVRVIVGGETYEGYVVYCKSSMSYLLDGWNFGKLVFGKEADIKIIGNYYID